MAYFTLDRSTVARRRIRIKSPSKGINTGDKGPPPPLPELGADGGGLLPPELGGGVEAAAGVALTSVDAGPLPAPLVAVTVK